MVTNIVEPNAAPCFVDQSTCDACCQYPLPTGPQLNPVLASLVFSFADGLQNQVSSNVHRQVELQQTKQFAKQWLKLSSEYLQTNDQPKFSLRQANPPIFHGASQKIRIGLLGSNSGFGLAHQNRDIVRHLGIDRWLIPEDYANPEPNIRCCVDAVSRQLSDIEMEAWLDGLDVVLFVERPVFSNAPAVARRLGILVVCVPNWEWLHPGIEWLQDVDLMVCPTQHTSDMLSNWKSRFDFKWDLTCVPWPVDTNRFQFRLRRVCKRFIFVNGSGGTVATVCGGSQSRMRRKGLDVALAAALQAPEISMIVYAFPEDVSYRPSNVELRPMPLDNRDLYKDGDVCVQPSHWEGLGLPLLECQAAGMPLITTNAPPMSEHHPLALIPAEIVASRLTQNLVIPAAHIQPDDLAAVLRSANGRRIGSQSRQARLFIEREHNWTTARSKILESIQQSITKN